ncbi:MAG: ParB N-terminal domain-containing protein, partial [Planctomycetota bacterium]
IDSYHVKSMVDSLIAGVELPAIIADKKSLRIADGFHRVKAVKKLYGEKGEVTAILKNYKSDIDLFLDAVKYNSGHGRTLTKYDKTHCVLRAGELNISDLQISNALKMTKEKAGELKIFRTGNQKIKIGTRKFTRRKIPIKNTINHMAGKDLTQVQVDVNERLSGMAQLFTVNQIIMLIESDLIDKENEKLMKALKRLSNLLKKNL